MACEIKDGVVVKYTTERSEEVIENEHGSCTITIVQTGVNIPEGVYKIGRYAFKDCTELKKVIIPEGVGIIGYGAFRHCSHLEEVVLPSTLVEIGYGAFEDCCLLKKIVLPESVRIIREKAFHSCGSLESVKLPKELDVYEPNVFSYCGKIREVVLSEGITELYNDFMACYDLRKIVFPVTLRGIYGYGFMQARSLKEIEISETVTRIDPKAFYMVGKELIIKGRRGSEAERFAKNSGFRFVEV